VLVGALVIHIIDIILFDGLVVRDGSSLCGRSRPVSAADDWL